ncbi:trypsin-like peptidase domain-containing protein [Candidatus Poribacteria bacterium]|nr:trypsin-like peptidase domain-containing protein [Candidatus Poribacteria bacterium]
MTQLSKSSGYYIHTLLSIILFGVIAYVFFVSSVDLNAQQDLQDAVTQSRRTAIVNAVERASPAVVNISAIRNVTQITSLEQWLWGDFQPFQKRSLREVGSGVIINKEGYILTNHHVIDDAERVRVAFVDGREFDAQIVGFDPLSDLALLKVNTKEDLPVIKWGDSDNLLIGEWALAIGNPFGLSIGTAQPTVTIGIISATQRSITVDNRFYETLIQTDASVNPGNSGGALVNVHGELIGINTVIRSTSGGSQGVGFAIPANKAKKVIQKITDQGYIIPPYLGVSIQSVTEDMAVKLLGKKVAENSILSRGVLVSDLNKDSPLTDAGIKRSDIIRSISGHRIKDDTDFKAVVRLLPLNEPIKLEVIRRGKIKNTTLLLKELELEYSPSRWGLTLKQPDKAKARKLKNHGVIITDFEEGSELDGPLRKGDVIYQINDITIPTLEVFKIIDEKIQEPSRIQLYYERKGKSDYIYVTFNRNNRWR